jgi:hypothetical protein
MKELIPPEVVENKILLIRGHKVILDRELAALYGVTTGNLNKTVSRNLNNFPPDFMFQLSSEEYKTLRFQFGILEKGAHAKYLPTQFKSVFEAIRMLMNEDPGREPKRITGVKP